MNIIWSLKSGTSPEGARRLGPTRESGGVLWAPPARSGVELQPPSIFFVPTDKIWANYLDRWIWLVSYDISSFHNGRVWSRKMVANIQLVKSVKKGASNFSSKNNLDWVKNLLGHTRPNTVTELLKWGVPNSERARMGRIIQVWAEVCTKLAFLITGLTRSLDSFFSRFIR